MIKLCDFLIQISTYHDPFNYNQKITMWSQYGGKAVASVI